MRHPFSKRGAVIGVVALGAAAAVAYAVIANSDEALAARAAQAPRPATPDSLKSVYAYGALCDGTANDTAAFEASIADQGTAYVPIGRCLINLVIATHNVRIMGHAISEAVPINSSLRAYDPAKPVITIGTDSSLVSGVRIDNISLFAAASTGTGTVGLSMAGGAYANYVSGLSVAGFTVHGIRVQGGLRYPASLNFFDGVSVVAPASAGAALAVLAPASGPSYTAANYFSNTRVAGPTTAGWAVEVDSADLHMSSSWVQAFDEHGVRLSKTRDAAPYLYTSDLFIDSDNSADTLLEVWSPDRVLPNYVRGTFGVDGLVEFAGGATTTLSAASSHTALSATLDRHVYTRVGGSSQLAWSPLAVYDLTRPVANAGAGETDLFAFTLEPNALDTNEQRVECQAAGNFGGNASRKTVRLYAGGEVVATASTTTANAGWNGRWTLVRTGQSTALGFGTLSHGRSGSEVAAPQALVVNTAAGIPFKVTGQGATANDVVGQHISCVHYPTTP